MREFMRASARAQDTRHCHLWPDYVLRGVYNVAAFPGITLAEWCAGMGIKIAEDQCPARQHGVDADADTDPTPDQIDAHNQNVVAQMRAAKEQGAESLSNVTIE